MEEICVRNKLPAIVDVEENLKNEALKYFKGEKDGYVQVGPKKWWHPIKYKKLAQRFIDFEVRSDDVWITGIPRSGTTVTQELAWLLSHDLDYEGAKEDQTKRVPFYEKDIVFNEKTIKERYEAYPTEELFEFLTVGQQINVLNSQTERRVIKTHLAFELLPPDIFRKGCKVIYVCRNPKDVAVSYCQLQSNNWHIQYTGDFPKFWSFFQNGHCMFGPYFEHVKQGRAMMNKKNFLFVFYEDLKKDLRTYIQQLSEFLERPLNEEEADKLEKYVNFENFKNNPSIPKTYDKDNKVHDFVRRGKVGGWRDYFSEEMNKDADAWIKKHTSEIGFEYPK